MLCHVLVALASDTPVAVNRLRHGFRSAPAIDLGNIGGIKVRGFALGTAVADEFIPVPSREDGCEDAATDPELVIAAALNLALGIHLRIACRLLGELGIALLAGQFSLRQLRCR